MTPLDRASWLPAALLLLWVPGCLSLSGPEQVTGTVGGSLSVQCRYKKAFTDNKKYWYKIPHWLQRKTKIVETTESEREVRNGRVSIRDHPENLTFTVTLENLRKDDEGTYGCGIEKSWKKGLWDDTFQVEVSVSPAPILVSPTMSATAKTLTTTPRTPTVSTAPARVNVTHSANSQDDFQAGPGLGLHMPLVLWVLLLLLLVGTSLLAWRMVRRRTKAGGQPEPLQNPSRAVQQSEPCYANFELQTWPLRGETTQPGQAEAEYSTMGPREDLHYTTVVFNAQNQGSQDKVPHKRRPQLEPEYSVIKKT